MKVIAYTDGAGRGKNIGAGIGAVFIDEDLYESPWQAGQNVLHTICKSIGNATSNEAEYRAIIEALEWWILESPDSMELEIRSDSQVVVRQLNGEYRVRADNLIPYWENATRLIEAARSAGAIVLVSHVPRTENKRADKLSKEGANLEVVP